jgi:hypothetical protein
VTETRPEGGLPRAGEASGAFRNARYLDLGAALLILVQVGVLFVLERGGFFLADDFLNLRLAQVSGLTLNYLMIPNFQHLEPGVRLEYWLVAHVVGLHYQWVLLGVTILIGIASWVLYRTLRLLFAPSPWMLALVVLFGLWAGWLGASTWLAAAFEVVPSALASMLALYAFSRRLNGGGDVWIATTAVAFGAGLAFYEGTMVVIPTLVLCALAAAADRSEAVRWQMTVRRAVAPVLWCLFVAAAFIAVFLSKVRAPLGHPPGLGALVAFLWTSWSQTFVPSLVGGPLSWQWTGPRGDGLAPLWWVVVTEVLLVAAVGTTIWRTAGRAAIGWSLVVLPFALLMTLVGLARVTQFGDAIGHDYQYSVDAFVPAVVGLGFVTMGRREVRRWALPPAVTRRALGGVLALCYLALFFDSAIPAGARWADNPGRPYEATLRAAVIRVDRTYPHQWSLYDTTVPTNMLFASAWPYTSLRSFTQLWGIKAPIDRTGTRLYVVEPDGQLRPGTLPASDILGASCAGPDSSTIAVMLVRPLPGGVWTLKAEFPGERGRSVTLAASSSLTGGLSAPLVTGAVSRAAGTVLLSFYWPGVIRRLELTVLGSTGPCLATGVVGIPTAKVGTGG